MTIKDYLKEWDLSSFMDSWDRDVQKQIEEEERENKKEVKQIKEYLNNLIKMYPDKKYPTTVKKNIVNNLNRLMKLNPKYYKFYRKRLLTQDVASYMTKTNSLEKKLQSAKEEHSSSKRTLEQLERPGHSSTYKYDENGNIVNLTELKKADLKKRIRELEIEKEELEKQLKDL